MIAILVELIRQRTDSLEFLLDLFCFELACCGFVGLLLIIRMLRVGLSRVVRGDAGLGLHDGCGVD